MRQSSLTKKQLAVIDEMFAGESRYIGIEAILEKHSVTRRLYNKWLGDESFKAEFTRRIEWLNLQSQALIARYASLAAAKLVALTDSEKEEMRRKACLDIISLPRLIEKNQTGKTADGDTEPIENLHPDTASRLLEALAQEKSQQKNDDNST
jgi:hypothetical protein